MNPTNDFDKEYDWENAIIPDFTKERKIFEERKKVEEADNILTRELFSEQDTNTNININTNTNIINQLNLEKKEKPRGLENRRQKLIEEQKQQSESIKKKKLEKKRVEEIYGESTPDEYDELYGYIQDKYSR